VARPIRPLSLVRPVLAAILVAFALSLVHAAQRKWQTGTWIDIGTARTPWIGDPASARLLGPRAARAEMTLVSTFVLETDDERIELQDVVPFGQNGSFEEQVTIGRSVTFAIEKTAYIRGAGGKEYRLLLTKRGPKAKRD
jgi:hypothetical protein